MDHQHMSASDPADVTAAASRARLLADFEALKKAAIAEAERAVDAARRRTPGRFYASRMTQSSLDYLNKVFSAAYRPAIESRLAQLDRLNRKLARSSDWKLRSQDELREPPPLYWRGGRS